MLLRLECQISVGIEHLIADDSDVADAGEYIHFLYIQISTLHWQFSG
jgi:hypothetical protein